MSRYTVIVTIITILVLILFIIFTKNFFSYLYKKKSNVFIKFSKSVITIIGITVILYSYLGQFEFSKEVSKTLLQSGSLIIALATFSCQQVLSNVISGFVLTSMKPFDIGDKVTLLSTSGGVVVDGVVVDMNIRHVVFKRPDGRCDFVTNNIVDSCIIENSNVIERNGRLFTIECSYDSDVNLAIELMEQEIRNCDLILKDSSPVSSVLCSSLNANGYELKTTIWTRNLDDNFKACSELRIALTKVWKENNIKIPYETVTIIGGSDLL